MSIGGVRIADYGYNSGNGSLDHIYYGFTVDPLASVSYGYDPLGRMVTESWYDPENRKSKVYGYNYSSNGNLAGITENGELAYSYDYDSLGRLIQSSRIEDGKRVLYTDHQYDTSDRILSQSWQIGDKGWEEAYTYNDKDGTLSQMTVTGGDKLTFGYDNLKRLSSKTLINEESSGRQVLKVTAMMLPAISRKYFRAVRSLQNIPTTAVDSFFPKMTENIIQLIPTIPTAISEAHG